jgi:transposase
MAVDDPAELERRLDAGEWLSTGEVAALLDVSRGSVHNWIASGQIGWKPKGGGVQRLCNPADVRQRLQRARAEYRGSGGGG